MRLFQVHSALRGPGGVVAGAVVVCIAIGAVADHGHVAAVTAVGILLIGLGWPWFAIKFVSVSATKTDRRCNVGTEVKQSVRVTNRWPLPIPGVRFMGSSHSVIQVEPQVRTVLSGHSSIEIRLRPLRRGVYPLSELCVATSFPFGLWLAKRPVTGGARLIVWPQAARINVTLPSGHVQAVTRERFSNRVSSEGELAGVRAYRRGDSMRSIHWQQTARHDRLIVRERVGHERSGYAVCLDTRRGSYPTAASFERAVSMMAGLIERASLDQLELMLFTSTFRRSVSNDQTRSAALDELARVEWQRDDPLPVGLRGMSGLFVSTARGWESAHLGRWTLARVDATSPVVEES